MKTPQDIILRPVITEQSSMQAAEGKYTFVVAKTASKPEIRQAVERLFDVKVTGVNTLQMCIRDRVSSSLQVLTL